MRLEWKYQTNVVKSSPRCKQFDALGIKNAFYGVKFFIEYCPEFVKILFIGLCFSVYYIKDSECMTVCICVRYKNIRLVCIYLSYFLCVF